MKTNNLRGPSIKVASVAATLGLLGLTIGSRANAGCNFDVPSGTNSSAHLTPAVYRPDDRGGSESSNEPEFWGPSIVGLWKIEFLAQGNSVYRIPDGALIDFGTAIWASDGTETMVSAGRNPTTGDVCMGAWTQVGPASFRLKHLALAWNAASGANPAAYEGPVSIVENVTLDSKNHFHGTFTITQYAASAAPGQEFQEDPASVVAPTPITGTITGTRLTAN